MTNLRKTSLAVALMAAICATVALDAGAAGLAATQPGQAAFVTVAHPAALRRGDALIGALPSTQSIHVVVALKLRNDGVLDALIANNAKAQAIGLAPRLMTSGQYYANHAPTPLQAQTVANYLSRAGFTKVVISPNRLLVSADGNALSARNAFMTTLAQVRTRDGRIAFANTDDVRISAALQDSVLSVIGLQNAHRAYTFAHRITRDAAHPDAVTGHFPTEFASIYGGASVAAASSVTVGIMTEGDISQTITDLNAFTAAHSLGTVTTQTVNTDGTSSDTSGLDEWDLDSQDIVGMSGGQIGKIVFYNIPSLENTDIVADMNTIETANKAKIINISLGECETDAKDDGSAASADAILKLAIAQGQTFSVAAGDSGADECGNGKTTPSWPADSQYVVAVTGTTLNASTTTWSSETVWSGSGGSPSLFEPQPSWQTPFIPVTDPPTTTRVVADVAFDADPDSGSKVIVNGSVEQIGGTSLAAPLFSGTWARVLQQYPGIGFAAPVIYALPESAFHDITSGSNGGESAGVGYDFASGRGSMIISNTVTDSASLGNQPPVANFTYTTSGLTADFTDTSTDSSGTIVTHKWTFGDGATASAANVNHTYAVAGNYSVRDQVVNNDGSVSGKIRTVTVTPGQLIGNPGFETGTASPWSMTTGVLQNNATLAHGGNWFAEIGNGGTGAHTDHVDQSVTIPSGYSSATLTFYLHTTTTETTTTKADDVLYVRIYNASGTLLATPVTYSNLNATSGYVQETVDMTPYIGQKVQIDFVGVNNATLETTWDLDDTSLTVQ